MACCRFKSIRPVLGFVRFEASELEFLTDQSPECGVVLDNKHGRS